MHTLSVSDWVWEAYRSPMAMRDTLARHAPRHRNDNGTMIVTKFATPCPVCKKTIGKNKEAVMINGLATHKGCVSGA